ncbi:MAG: hypothetical protein ACLFUY_02680 [Desulfobacterales bacterium]
MQHFLYFFPLPQGQGSLRPILVPFFILTTQCGRSRVFNVEAAAAGGGVFNSKAIPQFAAKVSFLIQAAGAVKQLRPAPVSDINST